jgi:hypothetical protein
MLYGSEFIVEMVAGQKLSKGDRVCHLEQIDGSDVDPEAAYSLADHPSGQELGVCLRGGTRGKAVVVEFPGDLSLDIHKSVMLYMMKKRMFERWLADRYPATKATHPTELPDVPAEDDTEIDGPEEV